ncbi:MAG TPA: hypothetical protein VIU46_04435 [Gallionellaceae bacterium]
MQMVLLVVVEIHDHRWYHHSDPDEYQQQCRLTKLENTFHDSSPLQIANLVLVGKTDHFACMAAGCRKYCCMLKTITGKCHWIKRNARKKAWECNPLPETLS